MRAANSARVVLTRSSVARLGRIIFSLDKTYHGSLLLESGVSYNKQKLHKVG